MNARPAFHVLDGPADQAFIDQLFRCLDRGIPVVPLNQRLPQAARRGQLAFLDAQPLFEGTATVLFTSGSSAQPKAVAHDLNAHVMSARGSNQNIRLGAGDRWLVSLPLYHVGGLAILFRCREASAGAVLRDPERAFGEQIEQDGITHLSLVPTQLQRLLQEGTNLLALKAVLLGGAVIAPTLVERALAAGVPLHTTYGMTECASQVTTTPPGASVEALATAGSVLPYRELSFDTEGQILVRGAVRLLGYVGGSRLPKDHWFATGDLGFLDAGGRLCVTGRIDRLFISGGENIHPETIERALLGCSAATRVVVVPRDDETFGKRPVAFVEATQHQPELWREKLTTLLPRFMVPDAFYPWPTDLPNGLKIPRSAWINRLENKAK